MIRFRHCLAAIVVGILAIAVRAELTGAPPVSPGESNPSATAPHLTKGMTAAQVVHLIGQPALRKTLSPTSANAEEWIYRRTVSTDTRLIPTNMPISSTFPGSYSQIPIATAEQFHQEVDTVEQITTLLMVNGQLVIGKQKLVEHKSFEN
jgi:hypothetical protein